MASIYVNWAIPTKVVDSRFKNDRPGPLKLGEKEKKLKPPSTYR
jgi:hypothetical protein